MLGCVAYLAANAGVMKFLLLAVFLPAYVFRFGFNSEYGTFTPDIGGDMKRDCPAYTTEAEC